jgi:hypothetical protein
MSENKSPEMLALEQRAKENGRSVADQQLFEQAGAVLSGLSGSTSPSSTSSKSTASSITKLTYNSAKAMLEQAAQEAGYPKTFTDAEINDYIKKFNDKQSEQIAKVVDIAKKKTTPGTDSSSLVEQTMREEYPSFFKPTDFAKDFIWSKVNFKDQSTLGAKAIGTLAAIRGMVDSFHIVGLNDKDVEALALAVAKGDKTLPEATVQVQQQAIKEYPQFAARFAKDPTLTTSDIASPVIDTLANLWEVDKSEIKWDNPLVMKWMNGAKADGNGDIPTKYEILLAGKKHPKYQETQAANQDARSAATALGSALGFGV